MPTVPPDLSEFDALAVPKSVQVCWFRRLNDEQRAKVLAAHDAGHSYPTIAKVVTGWGVPIKGERVGIHVRGDCHCGK